MPAVSFRDSRLMHQVNTTRCHCRNLYYMSRTYLRARDAFSKQSIERKLQFLELVLSYGDFGSIPIPILYEKK